MGKVPYYPDSETDASSSAEITKKKKKFSILKYTKRSEKKKCKAHSLPEMEEPEYPTQNKKLRGILKHDIRDLPVVRKMSSQQRRDMINRLSAIQESSPIDQEYIAQFLGNKELCTSETQIPDSDNQQETRCEIINENKPVPGTFQDNSSMASEHSEASQGSFILGDPFVPDFFDSNDPSEEEVENIERCLMIGLVIGRALTGMSEERRNQCLIQLSNFFNQENFEQYTDYNSDVYSASEEDLTDVDIPLDRIYPVGKCLVGRVPRPAGARPGHCGGVAIVVRKNPRQSQGALRAQASNSGSKAREAIMKSLTQKKSY